MRTGRPEPVALDSVAARPCCSILRQVLLGLEVLQRIEEGKDGVVLFDLKRKSGGPDSSRSTEGGRWLRRALLLLLAVVVRQRVTSCSRTAGWHSATSGARPGSRRRPKHALRRSALASEKAPVSEAGCPL